MQKRHSTNENNAFTISSKRQISRFSLKDRLKSGVKPFEFNTSFISLRRSTSVTRPTHILHHFPSAPRLPPSSFIRHESCSSRSQITFDGISSPHPHILCSSAESLGSDRDQRRGRYEKNKDDKRNPKRKKQKGMLRRRHA
ncbi:hypothetical protein Trydic_g11893 [Trypoxylus dichotomus]